MRDEPDILETVREAAFTIMTKRNEDEMTIVTTKADLREYQMFQRARPSPPDDVKDNSSITVHAVAVEFLEKGDVMTFPGKKDFGSGDDDGFGSHPNCRAGFRK